MAQGRMLKKEISDSTKLGLLHSDRSRVLYFMMLPHLDMRGRLKADPKIIKGQITTMLPYSTGSIQNALEELHKVGLIILYQADSDQCLEYTRFSDFQTINPDRETESRIPAPAPENSGGLQRTPLKDKLNISKVKVKDKSKEREFVPPTIEEVDAYCIEKDVDVIPDYIWDFYEKKGWKVGKTLMTNWRSAVSQAQYWESAPRRKLPVKIDPEAEAAALEKRKQEIRDDEGQYYREQTTENLQKYLADPKSIVHRWLLREILAERAKK